MVDRNENLLILSFLLIYEEILDRANGDFTKILSDCEVAKSNPFEDKKYLFHSIVVVVSLSNEQI